jgi:LysR family glycine cleavage system transcriptional activator
MARRLPPLTSLRAFDAAARHLNLTAAAKELHVTHGAVSRQVQQLEDYLGRNLFERLPRGLRLTPDGRLLAEGTRDAFQRLTDAVELLGTPERVETITISTLPSLAARWLVPRTARFQKEHPGYELRVSTTTRLVDFRSEDIDLAIRYGRGDWPGLHVMHMFTPKEAPVCAPQFIKGKDALKTPADLKRVTLLHDMTTRHWMQWLELAGVKGIDARKGPVYEDMNVVIQAAIEGQGVALASNAMVFHDLAAGRLVRPFALELPVERTFYAVCPTNRVNLPHVRALLDWLAREAAATN